MRIAWRKPFAAGVIVGMMAAGAGTAAAQISIGSLVKLFGIGYVVTQFGPQINSAINTLILNNKAENKAMTKVVPIITVAIDVGTTGGAYIGAAQVQGPAAAVNTVQAVAELDGSFMNQIRLRALVPVDSLNPLPGNLHRVYGVGVTALVDFLL